MSLNIIRALSSKLGIPLEVLARDYALKKPKRSPRRKQATGKKKHTKRAA